MNAQTNAMAETRFATDGAAAQRMRVTRPFYWSLRRELWEHWWIWGAPLAAAALVVAGMLAALVRTKGDLLSADPAAQQLLIKQQCDLVGLLIMFSTFLVAVFYCLDAFYGERRDRSVLFWRSLPVSDTATVLAKASIPLVVLPLLTFVVAFVVQWVVLGLDAASLAAHGRALSVMGRAPIWEMQVGLLYHLVAVHALWYAPIYGWLLFVSAWARRAPILWAFLPPLAIGIVEKIAFRTSHFASYIGYRMSEGPSGSMVGQRMEELHPLAGMNPGQFLLSPGLWGGLFVAGLFLAGAVQLRRYRSAN